MAKENGGSFGAAVIAYNHAVSTLTKAGTSANNEACRVVALGFLGRMTKGDINDAVKTAGGHDDESWSVAKVALSRAWRSVGGEYGFGDALAEKWANGDFSISLGEAYKESAPPAKPRDVVAECVKLMLTLSPADRQGVIKQVTDADKDVVEHMKKRSAAFAKLFTKPVEVAEVK